jgi:hypothetical protein
MSVLTAAAARGGNEYRTYLCYFWSMKLPLSILFAVICVAGHATAADEMASGTSSDGMSVPYVLTMDGGGRPPKPSS